MSKWSTAEIQPDAALIIVAVAWSLAALANIVLRMAFGQ
jgi:hypothetical protein